MPQTSTAAVANSTCRVVAASLRAHVRAYVRALADGALTATSIRVRDAREPTPVGGAAKFRRIRLFFNASPPYPCSKPP